MLDKAALNFLEKLVKGSLGTGDFNLYAANEALTELGWTIQETTKSVVVKESEGLSKYDFGQGTVWGYTGVKEPKFFWFHTQEEAEQGFNKFLKVAEQVTLPPEHPPVDKIFYKEIIPVHLDPPHPWAFGMNYIWTGHRAWEIRKNTAVYLLQLHFKRSSPLAIEKAHDLQFLKFLIANGVKEEALAYLASIGQDKINQVVRPTTIRLLENTGTCPVCLANVKLDGRQQIMRHGWDVCGNQGYGHGQSGCMHQGECYGWTHLPLEISVEGAQAYLRFKILPAIVSLKEKIQTLRTNPPDVLHIPQRRGYPIEVSRGTPEYDVQKEKQLITLSNNLKAWEQEKIEFNKRISTWKAAPLPGQKQALVTIKEYQENLN